jgi:hypothetical protein
MQPESLQEQRKQQQCLQASCTLTSTEISFIINGEELDDSITTKAMELINIQNPWLNIQPTSLSSIPDELVCSSNPTIFVHHIRSQHHFLMSTSIGGQIRTFDSLNLRITNELRHQLDGLYAPDKTNRTVRHMQIQHQQQGQVDCGLFAIAYATEAAHGQSLEDLAGIKFEQGQMRKHLIKCFDAQEMRRFPQVEPASPRGKHRRKGARRLYNC